MSEKKTIHLCNADQKFIPPFIDFADRYIDSHNQIYFIFGDLKQLPEHLNQKVFFIKNLKSYLTLMKHLCFAKKVILHGLLVRNFVYLLACQPWLLKKSYWIIWGADLYYYKNRPRNLRHNIHERFRSFIIKRFAYLVTGTYGDYKLALEWYGAKGANIKSFNYPNNIFYQHYIKPKITQTTTNILIGNSSDPTNNHEDILLKLQPFKNHNIKIYAPLSYGSPNYAAQIISMGHHLFGDKFIPLTNFMTFDEYIIFLNRIDIAIFNHQRQQAFGNIMMLLGLGKKVYLNSQSTLNGVFHEMNIKIFNTSDVDIDLLPDTIKSDNIEKILKNFSHEQMVASLNWLR